MQKYTKETLDPLVAQSVSFAGVLRLLGFTTWSGGTQNYIADKIRSLGIDTSHFTGMGSNRGPNHVGGPDKLHWDQVLVFNRVGRREHATRLRRAMLESGILHQCSICSLPPMWNGKTLALPIDHINGDRLDNRKQNVRFLCPNCHSQTSTFGAGNRRSSGVKVAA